MPAGASVPFVHAHRNNEEIYLVLAGGGWIELDGEKVDLSEGVAVRVAPPVDDGVETTQGRIWTIWQVAGIMGLPTTTLRYYEKEGLLPPVERNAGGQRRYGLAHLEALRFVECMNNGPAAA